MALAPFNKIKKLRSTSTHVSEQRAASVGFASWRSLSGVAMIAGKRYNASGGGTITDDTDCICSQNIQIIFKAREVDNGVPPFPLEP